MSIYGSALNSCVYISLYSWVKNIYLHWWVFIHIFWQKERNSCSHFMYKNQICKAQSFPFPRRKKSNLISFTLGHDVAELREEKKVGIYNMRILSSCVPTVLQKWPWDSFGPTLTMARAPRLSLLLLTVFGHNTSYNYRVISD